MKKNLLNLLSNGHKPVGSFLSGDEVFLILQKGSKIKIFSESTDSEKTRNFDLFFFKEEVNLMDVPLDEEDIKMVHRMYYEDQS